MGRILKMKVSATNSALNLLSELQEKYGEKLTKAMGGTMHSMDIVRGSYDFVVITEGMAFEDFAAVKLVVEASGAVKNMTMLETIDFNKATTKASQVAAASYKAPGQ